MKDRPILFSPPMVLAIMDGRKKQTRRLVTPGTLRLFDLERGRYRPTAEELAIAFEEAAEFRSLPGGIIVWTAKARDYQGCERTRWQGSAPYEQGDTLWVRENLRRSEVGPWVYVADDEPVEMRAGDPRITEMVGWAHHKQGNHCPSMHMPRWASRISLRCDGVRIERLHDITEDDALAEGIIDTECDGAGEFTYVQGGEVYDTAVAAYRALWVHLNGQASWDANPLVWVYSFDRLTSPP